MNTMQNICCQTAAKHQPVLGFFWSHKLVSMHNVRDEQVSVISSEIVSVCMQSSLGETYCSFWERRWRFGWGVNFHDLTSHAGNVELLMITCQKG